MLEVSTTESQVAVESLQEILCVCASAHARGHKAPCLSHSWDMQTVLSLHPLSAIHAQPQTVMNADSQLTFLALERQHWMLCVALCAPAPKGTNLEIF